MDARQRVQHLRRAARIEAAQRVLSNRLRDGLDGIEVRLRCALQVHAIRAAIRGIRSPLDEARERELIDDARKRDRLHLERLREHHLPYAVASRQMHERTRLRERQRRSSLPLPECATHQARDVGDEKAEMSGLCGQWRQLISFA